jgi:hypothetical protein
MAFSQLRPLSLGEVLDGAFTIYRRQFVSLFLTALVPQLPLIALVMVYYGFLATVMEGGGDISGGTAIAAGIAVLVLAPLAAVGTATAIGGVAFQAARAYTGAPVTTREAMERGLKRSLPLVGAYIVVGIMAMFGLLAFIIGAIIVWVSAFAVVPAVVLERRGPIDAIGRSWQLVKGAWGEVFLVLIIAYFIAAMPGFAVGMVTTIGGMVATGFDQEKMMAVQGVGQVLSQVARTLTIPFSIGTTVLLYYDRRVRTEALDVQMMAESLPAAPATAPAAPGWG